MDIEEPLKILENNLKPVCSTSLNVFGMIQRHGRCQNIFKQLVRELFRDSVRLSGRRQEET